MSKTKKRDNVRHIYEPEDGLFYIVPGVLCEECDEFQAEAFLEYGYKEHADALAAALALAEDNPEKAYLIVYLSSVVKAVKPTIKIEARHNFSEESEIAFH